MTCARCGAETNCIIHCEQELICEACCRRCHFYDDSLSFLYCRRPVAVEKFRQRLSPGLWYVVRQDGSPAVVKAAEKPLEVWPTIQHMVPDATAKSYMLNTVQELKSKGVTCWLYQYRGLAVGFNKAAALLLRDLINKEAST